MTLRGDKKMVTYTIQVDDDFNKKLNDLIKAKKAGFRLRNYTKKEWLLTTLDNQLNIDTKQLRGSK